MAETKESKVTEEKPVMLNGKEVKDLSIRCQKHGNIAAGSIFLRYSTIRKTADGKEKRIDNNQVMCMACLNEFYIKLQHTPKVTEEISYSKDANGALILDANGDPQQIVTKKISYLKKDNGELILDSNGNPIPEMVAGEVSVSVIYKDDTEAKPEN